LEPPKSVDTVDYSEDLIRPVPSKEIPNFPECNYDENPTELYKAIEAKQWDAVRCFLLTGKWKSTTTPSQEATSSQTPSTQVCTWVTKYEVSLDGTGHEGKWTMLPIHAAFLYRAPDDVIRLLLKTCPGSAKCADDQRWLPLHFAFKHNASDTSIGLLLDQYPGALAVRSFQEETPVDCALVGSPTQRSKIIQTIVDKHKSEWQRKQAKMETKLKSKKSQIRKIRQSLECKEEEVSNLNVAVDLVKWREDQAKKALFTVMSELKDINGWYQSQEQKRSKDELTEDLATKITSLQQIAENLTAEAGRIEELRQRSFDTQDTRVKLFPKSRLLALKNKKNDIDFDESESVSAFSTATNGTMNEKNNIHMNNHIVFLDEDDLSHSPCTSMHSEKLPLNANVCEEEELLVTQTKLTNESAKSSSPEPVIETKEKESSSSPPTSYSLSNLLVATTNCGPVTCLNASESVDINSTTSIIHNASDASEKAESEKIATNTSTEKDVKEHVFSATPCPAFDVEQEITEAAKPFVAEVVSVAETGPAENTKTSRKPFFKSLRSVASILSAMDTPIIMTPPVDSNRTVDNSDIFSKISKLNSVEQTREDETTTSKLKEFPVDDYAIKTQGIPSGGSTSARSDTQKEPTATKGVNGASVDAASTTEEKSEDDVAGGEERLTDYLNDTATTKNGKTQAIEGDDASPRISEIQSEAHDSNTTNKQADKPMSPSLLDKACDVMACGAVTSYEINDILEADTAESENLNHATEKKANVEGTGIEVDNSKDTIVAEGATNVCTVPAADAPTAEPTTDASTAEPTTDAPTAEPTTDATTADATTTDALPSEMPTSVPSTTGDSAAKDTEESANLSFVDKAMAILCGTAIVQNKNTTMNSIESTEMQEEPDTEKTNDVDPIVPSTTESAPNSVTSTTTSISHKPESLSLVDRTVAAVCGGRTHLVKANNVTNIHESADTNEALPSTDLSTPAKNESTGVETSEGQEKLSLMDRVMAAVCGGCVSVKEEESPAKFDKSVDDADNCLPFTRSANSDKALIIKTESVLAKDASPTATTSDKTKTLNLMDKAMAVVCGGFTGVEEEEGVVFPDKTEEERKCSSPAAAAAMHSFSYIDKARAAFYSASSKAKAQTEEENTTNVVETTGKDNATATKEQVFANNVNAKSSNTAAETIQQNLFHNAFNFFACGMGNASQTSLEESVLSDDDVPRMNSTAPPKSSNMGTIVSKVSELSNDKSSEGENKDETNNDAEENETSDNANQKEVTIPALFPNDYAPDVPVDKTKKNDDFYKVKKENESDFEVVVEDESNAAHFEKKNEPEVVVEDKGNAENEINVPDATKIEYMQDEVGVEMSPSIFGSNDDIESTCVSLEQTDGISTNDSSAVMKEINVPDATKTEFMQDEVGVEMSPSIFGSNDDVESTCVSMEKTDGISAQGWIAVVETRDDDKIEAFAPTGAIADGAFKEITTESNERYNNLLDSILIKRKPVSPVIDATQTPVSNKKKNVRSSIRGAIKKLAPQAKLRQSKDLTTTLPSASIAGGMVKAAVPKASTVTTSGKGGRFKKVFFKPRKLRVKPI